MPDRSDLSNEANKFFLREARNILADEQRARFHPDSPQSWRLDRMTTVRRNEGLFGFAMVTVKGSKTSYTITSDGASLKARRNHIMLRLQEAYFKAIEMT